jgi:murein DD-endopeptidase MepM/ murein hydrolase activator NlpD
VYASLEKVEKTRSSGRIGVPTSAGRERPFALGATRILIAFFAAATVALALPALASAGYGWPIKPFGQEHPVRGQLNDPRLGEADLLGQKSSFHNGIDIPTPDGTPVYAVAAGRVSSTYPRRVTVAASGVSYQYWHVTRVVRFGQRIKLHQLLAYVYPGYGHLHLAEVRKGEYVNPLRLGALTPYTDNTAPTISAISLYDGTYHDLTNATVSGKVRLTANAFDMPQLVSPWPWAVVTPAWIGWQLFAASGQTITTGHWDLGSTLYPANPLKVFAPGTRKNSYINKVSGVGSYDYWLGPEWDTTRVSNGAYRVVVTVADIRDNKTTKIVNFTVANNPAAVTSAPPASSPPAG